MTLQNNLELRISFGATQYIFAQPAGYFPATEVAVLSQEEETRTSQSAPLILAYDGAQCVYRGILVHPSGKDSASSSERCVEVALKWVAGAERIARLRQEANIYEARLAAVQGTVVPRYYGYYTGVIQDAHIACIVLEWCSKLPSIRNFPIHDVCELNRQRMCAIVQLHNIGIYHGRLVDPGHFLMCDDGTLRIVGFSTAKTHQCPGALPLTLDFTGDPRPEKTCSELNVMESWFGVDAERYGRELRLANVWIP